MRETVRALLVKTFDGLSEEALPGGFSLIKGKVRDIIDLKDELLIITSDRISAFDRVLSTIPCKGQVLNELTIHWLKETGDICRNHLIKQVSDRSMLVRKCNVLPVEVIVRGYITGSAWRDYQAGKAVSGITLPDGLRMNQRFDLPIITPSTKAEMGEHDEPISSAEIVRQGLVEEALWRKVEEVSLKLFARGTEKAAAQGLILVDTKYEFGTLDGELYLVDEVHTPDSSRYWFADTYEELFERGEKQRKLDKEYLRQWLMEQGFMGQGEPPEIPEEIRIEVALRYIQAYEQVTGKSFSPSAAGFEAEEHKILSFLSER
jgi:phosphoribosylaminoimidazole-succinocarboxamide synthase